MRQLPEEYVITDVTEDDIPALVAADRAASMLFEDTGLISPEALTDTIPHDAFAEAIKAEHVIVARHIEGYAVGFTLTSLRGKGLYLDQISVHPEHGQCGIGTELMMHLLQDAEDRKLPYVTLSTFRDLPWNAPFYASMGFREIHRNKFDEFMFEIEEAQRPLMDVAARCFMRRRVRAPLFRRKKPA